MKLLPYTPNDPNLLPTITQPLHKQYENLLFKVICLILSKQNVSSRISKKEAQTQKH